MLISFQILPKVDQYKIQIANRMKQLFQKQGLILVLIENVLLNENMDFFESIDHYVLKMISLKVNKKYPCTNFDLNCLCYKNCNILLGREVFTTTNIAELYFFVLTV